MALPQLEVLADIVDAQAEALGISRCFTDHTPDAEFEAVMIRVPLTGTPINHYLPGILKNPFQAIVRSRDPEVGNARAMAVFRLLTLKGRRLVATDGTAVTFNHLLPRWQPIAYQRSPGNLYEWSVDFESHYWVSGFDDQEAV